MTLGNSMDKNIHKECEKTLRKHNKGNRPDEGIEGIRSQGVGIQYI